MFFGIYYVISKNLIEINWLHFPENGVNILEPTFRVIAFNFEIPQLKILNELITSNFNVNKIHYSTNFIWFSDLNEKESKWMKF